MANPSPGPRRWVTEEQVLWELERLNDASVAAVQEFAAAAQESANAEADYKRLKARAVLKAKATQSGRGSISEAEYSADADDEVASAYVRRLTSTATTEAIREKLRSIRTNQEVLRTAAASNRNPVTGA
jgi:hypothetical protein